MYKEFKDEKLLLKQVLKNLDDYYAEFYECTVSQGYSVNWAVWSIERQDDGSFVFDDGMSGFPATKDGIIPFCSGYTKWDGCSNFTFDEQEECMLHTCEKQDMLDIGIMLAEVRKISLSLITKADEEID
jgi:hypothetical protein